MRLEDFLLLDGWEWRIKTEKIELTPGTDKLMVNENGKGYFHTALLATGGAGDAKYVSLEVELDKLYYVFLNPYGLNTVGLDEWTPYGAMVLRYDVINNIYIVASIPAFLIPFKNEIKIKVSYPKQFNTIYGVHTNTDTVTAYVLYAYIKISDERAFYSSLKGLCTAE